MKPKRRLRNFLLDAKLQLRLASYLIGVGVALSLGLGILLWRAYQETSRVVALSDPDAGDSIALAYGAESAVGKAKDGKEAKHCLIWTDTWLKRAGKWQIVAAQDTKIPCKP